MRNFKVSWRIILISSLITAIILILPIGFAIAEKNTKQIGFEDYTPFLMFQNNPTEKFISFSFMGGTYTLDFTSLYNFTNNISNYLNDFIK